jgi:hypothetical protein
VFIPKGEDICETLLAVDWRGLSVNLPAWLSFFAGEEDCEVSAARFSGDNIRATIDSDMFEDPCA